MLLMKSEEGYLLQTLLNCEKQNFVFNQDLELIKAKRVKVKIKSNFS